MVKIPGSQSALYSWSLQQFTYWCCLWPPVHVRAAKCYLFHIFQRTWDYLLGLVFCDGKPKTSTLFRQKIIQAMRNLVFLLLGICEQILSRKLSSGRTVYRCECFQQNPNCAISITGHKVKQWEANILRQPAGSQHRAGSKCNPQ